MKRPALDTATRKAIRDDPGGDIAIGAYYDLERANMKKTLRCLMKPYIKTMVREMMKDYPNLEQQTEQK